MNYKYIAFDEIEETELDVQKLTSGKKIKEKVTVTIEIEIEKSKYLKIREKFKNPIPTKIADIFK